MNDGWTQILNQMVDDGELGETGCCACGKRGFYESGRDLPTMCAECANQTQVEVEVGHA